MSQVVQIGKTVHRVSAQLSKGGVQHTLCGKFLNPHRHQPYSLIVGEGLSYCNKCERARV